VSDVNEQLRLDGTTAWVTGAGKGLGRAIALALSQAGAHVAVTARTASDLESLAAQLGAEGRKALIAPRARPRNIYFSTGPWSPTRPASSPAAP
jgi:NAD(P)-dependent dehydrogenase (short-subunit alcohol dehydrogenase family)